MEYREYNPDVFVILKVFYQGDIMYRTLGGWYGGYLDGDSWRLSSPIVSVNMGAEYTDSIPNLQIYNESGSVYNLGASIYKLSTTTFGVLNSLMESTAKQTNISVIMFESFEEFLEDFNEYKESEEHASRNN